MLAVTWGYTLLPSQIIFCSRCHTKRRIAGPPPTNPSSGMTTVKILRHAFPWHGSNINPMERDHVQYQSMFIHLRPNHINHATGMGECFKQAQESHLCLNRLLNVMGLITVHEFRSCRLLYLTTMHGVFLLCKITVFCWTAFCWDILFGGGRGVIQNSLFKQMDMHSSSCSPSQI